MAKLAEHEIALTTSRQHGNAYTGVSLSAIFTGPSRTVRVNGFWDGGQLFKIRMLPTEAGEWRWTTTSSDPELDGIVGSFLCEPSSLPGYVRVSKALPHSFEWAGTNEPFFLMGDTIWHMYYNLRFFDGSFQQMIDDRAAQRFNYAHGVVHDFLHNEGGPIYSAQDPVREMFDTNTLNPAYFHVIDRKIDYMNARGIAAGLFFSWGNEGYQEYETFGQYERYMRYLVARYASKNVFWILVGELEEAGEPRSRWRDYASVVSRSDPYGHPISLHTVATTDSFGPDADHSFVSQQRFGSPEELRRLVSESRIYQKPVVNLEYGYEGDPAVFGNNQFPDEVRKDHYALALAGGYGVYGNHTPWYSTYHRVGDFVLGATDTPGAEYLRILFDFFSGTSFHRLRPAQELTSRGIAAAWDGQEYVIQLPMGGDVEVDLTNALQTYRAVWFDPRTGGRASLATVDGGGRRSFTAPDGRDWILLLQADGLGGPDSVQIDLGEDIEAGILHPSAGDGNTSVASISGRLARTNTDPPSDRYFYFSVSDAFAFEGNRADVFITVDYFDGSSGSLSLQYDSSEGAFKAADSVVLTGAQTWKSHTFHVTDAFFGNRQNSGADFRFFGAVGQTSYLDVVRVTTTGTGPPAPATNPLPDDGAAEIEPEGLRLSWNPGSGASAHDVYFATTSPLPFEGRQTSIGFEPGTSLSRGTTYLWRIDEVNVEGVTTGNVWSFVTAMTAPARRADSRGKRGTGDARRRRSERLEPQGLHCNRACG